MPAKKTTAGYKTQIVSLWQICLMKKGLLLPLESKGQAVHIRQQMYAYRKLAREELRPDAVEMDDYTLEILEIQGVWHLQAKLSGLARQISKLMDEALSTPAESTDSHHNPISLTPSGIPMQQPETLKPVVDTEQALKMINDEAIMRMVFGKSSSNSNSPENDK